MLRSKLTMILIVALLSVGGVFYLKYQADQKTIATLRDNNAKLEVAAQSKQAAIDTLQKSANDNARLIKDLQTKLTESEAYLGELRKTLRKHDLTNLARNKPGLIEKRINDASNKLLDDIVTDTTR